MFCDSFPLDCCYFCRIRREEEARQQMEEARRLAEELQRKQYELEMRLRFNRSLRMESRGLAHAHEITRAFVFSYFELLQWLGLDVPDFETWKKSQKLWAVWMCFWLRSEIWWSLNCCRKCHQSSKELSVSHFFSTFWSRKLHPVPDVAFLPLSFSYLSQKQENYMLFWDKRIMKKIFSLCWFYSASLYSQLIFSTTYLHLLFDVNMFSGFQ